MAEEAEVVETVEKPASDSLITAETAPLNFAEGKPENFPDNYWDAEKNAPNIDQLFKDFNHEKTRAEGLRAKLSRGEFDGKAAKDVSEYTMEMSEEIKAIVPDNDPIWVAAKEAALAAGLPKEAFGKFMGPVLEKLYASKQEMDAALEAGPTPEEIEQVRMEEIAKLGPTGSKIVNAVGTFFEQLHAGGTLSDSEKAAALAMANNADAVRVLNKLRMMAGGQDQVPIDMPVDSGASKTDIEAKMAKAFADKNEDEYNKFASMLKKLSQ